MRNYVHPDVESRIREQSPPFGFGLLSHVVYKRTYSRWGQEEWQDTVMRVVNGLAGEMYNMGVWDEARAQMWASDAADHVFHLRWSPPGRGLQMMGTEFVHDRRVMESLLNCAFVSTDRLGEDGGEVLAWIARMLMLGVGVGADLKGAGKVFVYDKEEAEVGTEVFVIPDSREGWAESIAKLFDSYTDLWAPRVKFDYSKIRPKGSPIHGFGGTASGPEPLMELHRRMTKYLSDNAGNPLWLRTLADIINSIGVCVVSGNIRRSAIILLNEPNDTFLNLKNYDMFPYREQIGWTSNNSVLAEVGQDYRDISERIMDNGEPGLVWLENVSKFGRAGDYDAPTDRAQGTNPCGEIPLYSYEMCNLTEIYMPRIANEREWYDVLRNAYMYAKGVSILYEDIQDHRSREIMVRNRRLGISVTGLVMAMEKFGERTVYNMLNNGYAMLKEMDKLYSSRYDTPMAIRLTTVKPSGTISLLAGVTPGVHYPPAGRYHIRRVRVAENSKLADELIRAGIPHEPDIFSPNTTVFSFPIDMGVDMPAAKDVSMKSQLSMVKIAQTLWSDNAVSVTVEFDPEKTTPEDIQEALRSAEDTIKTVSFLPAATHTYPQQPYEPITEEQYREMARGIEEKASVTQDVQNRELYCTTDACVLA